MKMTAIWTEILDLHKYESLIGGAVFDDGTIYVSVRSIRNSHNEFSVSTPEFFWAWSEPNYLWDDVGSPEWYINQVYHSISRHLGADALEAIRSVPEAIEDVFYFLCDMRRKEDSGDLKTREETDV